MAKEKYQKTKYVARHIVKRVAISTGNSLLSYIGMAIAGYAMYSYILPQLKKEGIVVPGIPVSTGSGLVNATNIVNVIENSKNTAIPVPGVAIPASVSAFPR